MSQSYDPHYLRAVAGLGDRRAVVARTAIFSQSGVKLVDTGARIDSRLYDRLVGHRLKSPIEQCLDVEEGLDAAAIHRHAEEIVAERPFCARLADLLGSARALLEPLSIVSLPGPLAFRLTLMREQRPELFFHTMQVTLVALFLAARSGMTLAERGQLAAAALLHDTGVLHIDPELLKNGHQLSPAERRHLFAHPLTGMLIAQEHAGYPAEIAAAILEHHERLDGSGYPRGLRGDEISAFGRILVLAEVVSAMFERNWDAPALRLSLVLRLNHRKFDRALVDHVVAVLRKEKDTLPGATGHEQALWRLSRLHDVFTLWGELAAPLAGNGPSASGAAEFLQGRLDGLGRSLVEAGVQPERSAMLAQAIDDDPEATAELVLLSREAMWQLGNIREEIHRRWPQLATAEGPADVAVRAWCERLDQYLT